MKRLLILTCLTLVASLAVPAAATPSANPPMDPGPEGLYLGRQADIRPVVTPEEAPVTWGAAPPIDERYGATIYPGTAIEQQDPRPALDRDGNEPLRTWVADPHDGRTGRPAIIWMHGGGFAVGIDSMWGLADGTAKDYARRGYVGFSMEYRIDTTLVGTGTATQRPPSLCQWVQDHRPPAGQQDPLWTERSEQCARNIVAAQYDTLAAVRWLRQNATEFGVDPDRIAVAGFSAGAINAANAAYQSDAVGDISYFSGDDRSPATSRPDAAFGASGCVPTADRSEPTTIDPTDVPFAMIQSIDDGAVEYGCVRNTIAAARTQGLVAELTSYCDESGHAAGLYRQHPAATDQLWTTFLARELRLYAGLRPPTTAGFCTGPISESQLGHYVARSYQDLLGRSPSAAELNAGVDRVGTAGRATFEGDLIWSREGIGAAVSDLYRTALEREPDDAGRDYWVGRVQAGVKVRDVAVVMYASEENWAAHGARPDPYVRGLYRSILDREPDPGGLAYWTALAGDRGRVAAGLYQSTEARERRVTTQYADLLRRRVDLAGRAFWAEVLLTQDDLVLTQQLVVGDEYFHDA